MKKAPLLPSNAAHGSIGDLVIRRSVERHPDGKAAFVLSNDLDAADGLASRPKPHRVETLVCTENPEGWRVI
jgi:hypothetical protein